MKILVVGSGGREHTLVWKIAQSPKVKKVFCTPGNAGISMHAECVPIKPEEIDRICSFAKNEYIDLTVVGPELPLTLGIVDLFEKQGLKIFGPSKMASQIEGSKSFAKKLMEKYNIPTAKGKTFTDSEEASQYVKKIGTPVVIKADGLAAGKGVIICETEKDAMHAIDLIMVKRAFGDAGKKILIEEYLTGEEASFLVFTDGNAVVPLPSSQDHKPIYDEDKGPNTGGMGAYSPAPIINDTVHKKIMEKIMIPAIKGMAAEGMPYKGVLYAGLMIKDDEPKVLEFNARFGDPEAQPLLIRLKSDLVTILEAVIEERLTEIQPEWDTRAAVCVVMASGGYPGSYKKGLRIIGIKSASRMKDVVVFHAGTTKKGDVFLTDGGRVLGVTALGDTIEKAIDRAYQAVSKIRWDGVYYRKDIGHKALRHLNPASKKPLVGIVMGSSSDLKIMEKSASLLKRFNIPYEMTISSAHRSPDFSLNYAKSARKKGLKVIIAAAGNSAHLAGFMAAHTTLPVIGVPLDSSSLRGLDALLSTVQMPSGVPVATMGIGEAGAVNAAILAAQILSTKYPELEQKLRYYKEELAERVKQSAEELSNNHD
nr:phosphoribosylamine--glycine ligase [Desulfobacterales bacterium]